MGTEGEKEMEMMIHGDATLHTDYIRFFPLLQRLVGGGARGRACICVLEGLGAWARAPSSSPLIVVIPRISLVVSPIVLLTPVAFMRNRARSHVVPFGPRYFLQGQI